MKITVHPAATADLNNAAAFYSEQANKQLGLALIAEFEKATLILSGNPELGAAWVSPVHAVMFCGVSLLTLCIVFSPIIFSSSQLPTKNVTRTIGIGGNKNAKEGLSVGQEMRFPPDKARIIRCC